VTRCVTGRIEIAGVTKAELRTSRLGALPAAPESLSRQAANGASLTRDESTTSFVIIRHNIRTYRSAGVVEVVKGRQNAETALTKFRTCQSSADYHEGWRYFFEKTGLKAGMDPAQATALRQADLESRESNQDKK
jgi:hypothetical protein